MLVSPSPAQHPDQGKQLSFSHFPKLITEILAQTPNTHTHTQATPWESKLAANGVGEMELLWAVSPLSAVVGQIENMHRNSLIYPSD